MTVTKRKKTIGSSSMLFLILILFTGILLAGCGSLVENAAYRADGIRDIAYSIESITNQIGETFRQGKYTAVQASNAIEAGKASFGEEVACFTPGLNVGEGFSMTFEVPGRPLIVVKKGGEKKRVRRVQVQDFQTVNAYMNVDNYATFMESYLVVKIYKDGDPVDMIKEKVSERYSKEDLTDKSCSAYFVESQDREKSLTIHNSQ